VRLPSAYVGVRSRGPVAHACVRNREITALRVGERSIGRRGQRKATDQRTTRGRGISSNPVVAPVVPGVLPRVQRGTGRQARKRREVDRRRGGGGDGRIPLRVPVGIKALKHLGRLEQRTLALGAAG